MPNKSWIDQILVNPPKPKTKVEDIPKEPNHWDSNEEVRHDNGNINNLPRKRKYWERHPNSYFNLPRSEGD